MLLPDAEIVPVLVSVPIVPTLKSPLSSAAVMAPELVKVVMEALASFNNPLSSPAEIVPVLVSVPIVPALKSP